MRPQRLGDTGEAFYGVNVAACLEQATKRYSETILASETAGERAIWREPLSGRAKPLGIYTLRAGLDLDRG